MGHGIYDLVNSITDTGVQFDDNDVGDSSSP